MAVNVGGISIELDGDAAGAITALEAAGKKVEELKLKEKDLALALEAATKAGLTNENGLRALQDAHAAASLAVSKATGSVSSSAQQLHTSTTKGAAGLGTLKQAGDKLDGAMGPLQIAIGGIGGALGGAGQEAANMVGGLADVGMVVSKLGGPVGLAAAALIALGVAAAKIYEISEESKAANRAWAASFDDVAKSLTSRFTTAITATRDAIKALVQQTREAGREGADILAEQALNEKKAIEKSIETLTRNRRLQQLDANTAEGAMQSAKAKGAVPDDIQERYEMTKQIIDTTAKRLEILGEALVAAKQNVADADAAWVESAQKAADLKAQQEKEAKDKSAGDEWRKRVADAEAKMAAEVQSAAYSMGGAAYALQAVGFGAAAFLSAAVERGDVVTPSEMQVPDAYDEFISSIGEFDWGAMADESMRATRSNNDFIASLAEYASSLEKIKLDRMDQGLQQLGGDILGGNLDAGALGSAIGTAAGGPIAGQVTEAIIGAIEVAFQAVVGAMLSIVGDDRFAGAFDSASASMAQAGGGALVAAFLALPALLAVGILGPLMLPFIAIFGLLLAPLILAVAAVVALVVAIGLLIGAIVGVFAIAAFMPVFAFSLAQSTKSFERFRGAMSMVVDKLVVMLEPFFEKMLFLVGLFDVATDIFRPFMEAFTQSAELGPMLFELMRSLMEIFAYLAIGAAHVTNGFIEVAAWIADTFTDTSDEDVAAMRKGKVSLALLTEALYVAQNITYDQAAAAGEAAAAAYDLAQAGEESADMIDQATYGATSANVPVGWKRSEFASAQGSMTAGGDTSVVYNLTIAEFVSSRSSMQDDIADLKRIARNGHKSTSATSRRFGDNKN